MLKFKLLCIGTLLSLMAPVNHASAPQVVVTIKPIHALVSGVMDGVGVFVAKREKPSELLAFTDI